MVLTAQDIIALAPGGVGAFANSPLAAGGQVPRQIGHIRGGLLQAANAAENAEPLAITPLVREVIAAIAACPDRVAAIRRAWVSMAGNPTPAWLALSELNQVRLILTLAVKINPLPAGRLAGFIRPADPLLAWLPIAEQIPVIAQAGQGAVVAGEILANRQAVLPDPPVPQAQARLPRQQGANVAPVGVEPIARADPHRAPGREIAPCGNVVCHERLAEGQAQACPVCHFCCLGRANADECNWQPHHAFREAHLRPDREESDGEADSSAHSSSSGSNPPKSEADADAGQWGGMTKHQRMLIESATIQAKLKLAEVEVGKALDPTKKQVLREVEFTKMDDDDLILVDPKDLARCPSTWSRYVNAQAGGRQGAAQRSRDLRKVISADVLPFGAPADFKGDRSILLELVEARLKPGTAKERHKRTDEVVDQRVVSYMIACKASVSAAKTYLTARAHSGIDPRVAYFITAEGKKPKPSMDKRPDQRQKKKNWRRKKSTSNPSSPKANSPKGGGQKSPKNGDKKDKGKKQQGAKGNKASAPENATA